MLKMFNACTRSIMSLPRILKVGLFGCVACGILALGLLYGAGSGLVIIFVIILLALVLIGLLIMFLFKIYSAKQSGKIGNMLVGEVKGEGPSHAAFDQAQKDLDDQWEKAISTLSERDVNLYEMPWYCILGEPASGKTTLLSKSGIQFLLGTNPLPGGKGTRNCEFLFAKAATILDTAGRFTFPQPGTTDEAEWEQFLRMLAKNRSRCPINGIIVTIPCTSLLEEDREKQQEKARILNTRLKQIQTLLGIVFPVYVLITKCDRILGFTEFFSKLPALKQNQIVGWTNPGLSADAVSRESVLKNLKNLQGRLQGMLFSLLSDKMDPPDRDPMYLFPKEIASVMPMIAEYCETIFQQEFHEENLLFRGIYFSSGVQQGKPIASACAQILSDVSSSDSDLTRELDQVFTKSRAFFISDLFKSKIFPEYGLVSPSKRRRQRVKKIQKTMDIGLYAYCGILLVALILGGIYTWKEIDKSQSALDELKSSHSASVQRKKEILTEVPDELEAYKDRKYAGWSWMNPVYHLSGSKRDGLYARSRDKFVKTTKELVIGREYDNLFNEIAQKVSQKLDELVRRPEGLDMSIRHLVSLFGAYMNVSGLSGKPEPRGQEMETLKTDMATLLSIAESSRAQSSDNGLLAYYLVCTKEKVFDRDLKPDFARVWKSYWEKEFKNPSADNWIGTGEEDYQNYVAFNASGERFRGSCRKMLELLNSDPAVSLAWVKETWSAEYASYAANKDAFMKLFKDGTLSLAAYQYAEGREFELTVANEIRNGMEKSYRTFCSFFDGGIPPEGIKSELGIQEVENNIDLKNRARIKPIDILGITEEPSPSQSEPRWRITPSENCKSFIAFLDRVDEFLQTGATGESPIPAAFSKTRSEKFDLNDLLSLEAPPDLIRIRTKIEEDHGDILKAHDRFLDSLERTKSTEEGSAARWLFLVVKNYKEFLDGALQFRMKRILDRFFEFLDGPVKDFCNGLDKVHYAKVDQAEIKGRSYLLDLSEGAKVYEIENSRSTLSARNIDIINKLFAQLDAFDTGKDDRLDSFKASFYRKYAQQFKTICDYYFGFCMNEDDTLEIFCRNNNFEKHYNLLEDILKEMKGLAEAFYEGGASAKENDNDALKLFRDMPIANILHGEIGIEDLNKIFNKMRDMGEEGLQKIAAKKDDTGRQNPLNDILNLSEKWAEKNESGAYLAGVLKGLHKYTNRKFGSFDAEDARVWFKRLKDEAFSKYAPFTFRFEKDIDKGEFARIHEDLKYIRDSLPDGDPDKAEVEFWIRFMEPFLGDGYKITLRFDKDSDDGKWKEFTGWYGFNVVGQKIEGYEKKKFMDLDTGTYPFTWNPLEGESDAFAICIFDKEKREKGWYLSKTSPENLDLSRHNDEEQAFKSAWGFLGYLKKTISMDKTRPGYETMTASHELFYKIRGSSQEKDIKVNVTFGFSPPFAPPPEPWWSQQY